MIRIDPDIHIGSDIFPDPYHCRYEAKSKYQIHGVVFFIRLIVYSRFSESEEYPQDDPPPDIDDKMMRKEIYIDEYGDKYRDIFLRIMLILKLENPPYTSDITPHSRVHKSCEKWNMHNANLERLRILPRSYRWMCLKYLHTHRDHMKNRYDSYLSPALELHHDEKYLEEYSSNKEKIISVHNPFEWIVVLRHNNHKYEKKSEYTRVCLLVDEYEEIVKELFHGCTIGILEKITKSIKNIKIKLTYIYLYIFT